MIDWNSLTTFLAVLVSVSMFILAWRKAPSETYNLKAESEAKISAAAVALIEPMQKRLDELEKSRERQRISINELERRITDLECELREEKSQKADILDGANKLVHQVESLGANPVYRPPRRGTGELKAPKP